VHADEARAYENLKRALAAQFTGSDRQSRRAYARAKTPFVERVVALALREMAPPDGQQE
jgi:GrpB-like predicted nucleotidyltransferase (UPF0157 family)